MSEIWVFADKYTILSYAPAFLMFLQRRLFYETFSSSHHPAFIWAKHSRS